MFRTVADFEAAWKQESQNTTKMLEALNQKAMGQAVMAGHRDIARMAWHIVTTIPEMAGRTGIKVEGPAEGSPVPDKPDKIVEAYKIVSGSLLKGVTQHWKDETLMVEDDMYGSKWKRGLSLMILLNHEIHHRAQMTVLMRQAGLQVPGIYGPSKEEWVNYGAQPPEI